MSKRRPCWRIYREHVSTGNLRYLGLVEKRPEDSASDAICRYLDERQFPRRSAVLVAIAEGDQHSVLVMGRARIIEQAKAAVEEEREEKEVSGE